MISRNNTYRRVDLKNTTNLQQGGRLAERSRMGKSRESFTPQRKLQQNVYPFKATQRKAREGQLRMDTLLDQNKYLLAENSQLSALVSERGKMILELQQKLQQQISMEMRTLEQIQFEKNRFIKEYHFKTNQYDRRIEALLEEINNLHQELSRMAIAKQQQINQIKNIHSIQTKKQVDSLMVAHNSTVELLQLEIYKLKGQIQTHSYSFNKNQQQSKMINDRLKHQNNSLKEHITHLNHKQKIQLSQQKISYENTIHDVKMDQQKQLDNTVLMYEMEIKKLKFDISNQKRQIQHATSSLHIGNVESKNQQNQFAEKKVELENQIIQINQYNKKKMFIEKQDLKKQNKLQLETLRATYQSDLELLRNQNIKMKQLNALKTAQFDKLYQQINLLRITKDQQMRESQRIISQLKSKLLEDKQYNLEDQQAFKTKMAILHHTDINSIKNYYQEQLAILALDIQNKDNIIKQNRDKIHKEIQEKSELRKIFDTEVNKLKIRIGELQIRLSIATAEKVDQTAQMNSKMDLKSSILIREGEHKIKLTIQAEQQKKKLQNIIKAKDLQIQSLNEIIAQMKSNNNQQTSDKDQIIRQLNQKCQDLSKSLKKQSTFYQNQLNKKQALLQSDKIFYEGQINKIKLQNKEQFDKAIKQLTDEKNIIQKQRNQLRIYKKNITSQLNRLHQHKQQQGMEKDVALETEKQRLSKSKNLLQVNLKSYYDHQLKAKNQEIKDLNQQLREKQLDIREMTQKQHKLQIKLSALVQSKDRLVQIENKVLGLGYDNNTIKNLSQIIKSRRKC